MNWIWILLKFITRKKVFSEITLEENNDAVKKMKLNAQENAIANGLLENARSNAETMLTGFLQMNMILTSIKLFSKTNKSDEK